MPKGSRPQFENHCSRGKHSPLVLPGLHHCRLRLHRCCGVFACADGRGKERGGKGTEIRRREEKEEKRREKEGEGEGKGKRREKRSHVLRSGAFPTQTLPGCNPRKGSFCPLEELCLESLLIFAKSLH